MRSRPRASGLTRRAALGWLAGGIGTIASRPARAQDMLDDLRGALDATHEGLSPDADEGQGQRLAAALAKAEGEARPLFLPPGRYRIADVTLPAHAHLIGVPGRTVLLFAGGAAMLSARHAAFLRLEGLTLDGDGIPMQAPALLDAADVADCIIDDCAFIGSGAAGLTLAETAGRVEHCRSSGNRTVGIDIAMARGMSVTGNAVADCGDTGILVRRFAEGEDGTIVTSNRVTGIRADSGGTGQNGNGINLDKANGVVIADNRVDDCAFSAVRCFSSDTLAVTGNVLTRSGEMALYVEFASEGAIVANNLIDGGNGGISFANFAEHGGRLGTCAGNIVRNVTGGPRYADGNAQIGAGISAEADMAVTGNVVEDCVWGLKLGWGPYLRDVTASGNTIRRTRIGIAVSVVEGAGPALVAGNLITAAEEGAILGMRWEEVATGELADGGETAENVTVTGNVMG